MEDRKTTIMIPTGNIGTGVRVNMPPSGQMTSVAAPLPNWPRQMKVGDKIMTVDREGNPVTLTIISAPRPKGNRHERRKADALNAARRIQKP